MPLLAPLNPDQRTTFLVVGLAPKTLRKLVGRLGTAPTGTRLETMPVWDLAWSLVDYYESDAEVARMVDKTLHKDLGESPLLGAARADGGGSALAHLVLTSRDPLRDLAWALLAAGEPANGSAADVVETIIKEFDEADARAKAEEEEGASEPPEAEPAET